MRKCNCRLHTKYIKSQPSFVIVFLPLNFNVQDAERDVEREPPRKKYKTAFKQGVSERRAYDRRNLKALNKKVDAISINVPEKFQSNVCRKNTSTDFHSSHQIY